MIVIDCEQTSDEWNRIRAGIPTGSNFNKLITSTGAKSKQAEKYAYSLAADAFAGEPLDRWDGNTWTERGKELEDQARAWYSLRTGNLVDQVGFVLDDDSRYGCSPDGLIGLDGCVEFKCQKSDCHTETLVYIKKHKKVPPTYVAQVQGEMLVCEREWNDLVFFHPHLPSIIMRQTPDKAFHTSLVHEINSVILMRDKFLSIIREYHDEA